MEFSSFTRLESKVSIFIIISPIILLDVALVFPPFLFSLKFLHIATSNLVPSFLLDLCIMIAENKVEKINSNNPKNTKGVSNICIKKNVSNSENLSFTFQDLSFHIHIFLLG